MADEPATTSTSLPDKKDRSHKKHKRHRETDGTEGNERKHKKSKSSANAPVAEPAVPAQIETQQPGAPIPEIEATSQGDKQEKKRRRRGKRHSEKVDVVQSTPAPAPTQDGAAGEGTSKKEKKKKSKEDKRKHDQTDVDEEVIPDSQEALKTANQGEEAPDPDSMDIDSAPAEFGQEPSKKDYPFFTQTVSQYLPLFPSGLIEPIEGFADQHLRPLLKRYVPSFRGVLLAYRKPRIGEAPGRASLTEDSSMEDVVLLESINEYAVTFGWLTVDVDVFRPTRGAWMEGTVNLQGEGHIGVVCWDMFNASIEAGRLPHGWRWVDLLSKGKDKGKDKKGKKNDREKTVEEAKLPTPEPFDDAENDTTQIHTTGYWVDENGTRIRGGSKVYFRIKHYEVGVSGDYGYLSIEGTMLNEEEEKTKYAEEMEVLRRRRLKNGGVLREEHKRLPEFSMTKFGVNEAEDNEAQRAPVQWVASGPGSDTE